MTGPITRHRDVESLKIAARWPDAEHAAALDLLARGREEQFTAAAATLISRGDHALAQQIIQPGLFRHPART